MAAVDVSLNRKFSLFNLFTGANLRQMAMMVLTRFQWNKVSLFSTFVQNPTNIK